MPTKTRSGETPQNDVTYSVIVSSIRKTKLIKMIASKEEEEYVQPLEMIDKKGEAKGLKSANRICIKGSRITYIYPKKQGYSTTLRHRDSASTNKR